MKMPSDFQTTLLRLFDYQKYHPVESLSTICEEAQQVYDRELSDDLLSMVHAAGDMDQSALPLHGFRIADSEE